MLRFVRTALAALLGASLWLAPLASPAAAAKKAAALAATVATPPLFRVSDADSTFYLLGTFHILPNGLDWRSREAGAALDLADAIWFEAETDTPAAQQRTQQISASKGQNPRGRTLSSMLSPDDAAKLDAVKSELQIPAELIEPMRPWLAFLVLSVKFIVAQGFDPSSGVDSALLAEARARGKQMRFLETVDQQLSLFTTLPPKIEKDLLVTALRDWDRQKAEFSSLFQAWSKGDVAAIDALMNESRRDEAPQVFEILVLRRNAAWADEIGAAISGGRGTAVVAVGAGHLAGEGSLPQLLAAKGFTVTQLGGPKPQP